MISWEKFMEDTKKFIDISKKIDDKWTVEGLTTEIGECYLKKTITVISEDLENFPKNKLDDPQQIVTPLKRILRWEYNVYYSLSYGVPVLCFNVWNENGNLLRLEDVWKNCKSFNTCHAPSDMYAVLTQQDHPILQRPFFTIHPCRTHEFLEVPDDEECNIVIRYLTSVGPTVNLTLDMAYGVR